MEDKNIKKEGIVNKTTTTLKGVFCPVITPFDEQLKPDKKRFVQQCHRVLDDGCHGLAVFGTTGEANSLSVEERMMLLDTLVESGINASVIVPGTGCTALTDSVQLTRHAVQLGCSGVLMLPPFYYKNVGAEGLFRAFSEVIEQVADDALKVYLYHIPPVSGVPLELSLVERLAEAYPNFVVGLKDSSGEWSYTETLLRSHPKFQVFSGTEEFLRKNLIAGGCGTITAVANVNASAIRAAYDNFQNDKGEENQLAITRRRKIIQSQPMIPALKSIIATITGDDNWRRVRPPLEPLSIVNTNSLVKSLTEDDYLPMLSVPDYKVS